MNFNHPPLEHVLAGELIQHLILSGMHDVTEIHKRFQFALEGDFYRFRNRHRSLAGGECQRDRPGVRPKRNALGHTRMGIAADNDCPFIHGKVVEHLVDDIGHSMIFAIGIAARDQPEIVHETHEARNIGLRFLVPY